MTIKSWFTVCSNDPHSYTLDDSTPTIPNSKQRPSPKTKTLFASDTTSCSSSSLSLSSTPSQETSCSTSSSLQSNLSLQTLPSIPSLQKTPSPETHNNISVSHLCLSSFTPHPNRQITHLAVSDSLLYVASGNEINVFDLTNNTQIDTFNDTKSGSGSVKSITFSTGKILTAHQDCKIRVWQKTEDNQEHKLISTLPTLKDLFRRSLLPKNYVRVRRHKKQLWIQHTDAVSGLHVTNEFIYSVSWDKSLKIWRSSDLHCLESIKAHEDAVNAVAVSNDGTVYTASADKRIKVWGRGFNEKKHSLIATLEKHKSAINALALSDDGSVLFSGACDRSILVWEKEHSAQYMSVTGALRGHTAAILCLIHVDGLLVSGSADRTVRVWQRRGDGYCCLAVMEGHVKPVKSLVAVPGGGSDGCGSVMICSGSLDGEVKVWQILVSNLKSSCPPLDFVNRNL